MHIDAELQVGENRIHDFHRSERLPINHINNNIIFLVRTFPFHTVCTLAEMLSVNPSTILHHLRDSFGLKPYHFR
jgi:hypothetical protein